MFPAIEHKGDKNAIPLPATMIHDLSSMLKNDGISVNLYSAFPFPNRQSRKLDSFQKNAWDYLNQNPEGTFVKKVVKDGQDVVRVAVADTMVAQGCVNCHNSHPDTPRTGWELGDVRGILEIDSDITAQVVAGKATALKIILFLACSLLLITAMIYFVYKKVIAKRIAVLHSNIDTLTSGKSDLTTRLESKGNDEFSQLATGFNDFLDSYHSLIREIYDSSQQITQSVEDLNSITTVAKEDSNQQRVQISSIVNAVDQMNVSIQNVSNNASEADLCASQAKGETVQGQKISEGSTTAIHTFSKELKEAEAVLNTLKLDSNNIGEILGVIQSVSDQTNLLALNAAIEAARAGEHWRGFAVVADEVRTLASRTNESAIEINNTIEKLQRGVDSAVALIEKSTANIDTSVEQSTQTADNFKSITQSVSKIFELNVQTAVLVDEQKTAANNISENVATADDFAKRSNEAANQITAANEKLNQLAENLHSRVERFKLH